MDPGYSCSRPTAIIVTPDTGTTSNADGCGGGCGGGVCSFLCIVMLVIIMVFVLIAIIGAFLSSSGKRPLGSTSSESNPQPVVVV